MLGVVASAATVAWFAALSVFSPTTIGGWAIIVIGVAGTIYGARAHARQRTGEVWETTARGYKEEAALALDRAERIEKERAEERREAEVVRAAERQRLESERDEQRALKHEALSNLSAMSAKTDLTAVMQALASIVETQAAQTDLLAKLVSRVEALSPMS